MLLLDYITYLSVSVLFFSPAHANSISPTSPIRKVTLEAMPEDRHRSDIGQYNERQGTGELGVILLFFLFFKRCSSFKFPQ